MTELPQVEGVTHRTVRARGVEFHVAEAGTGEDVVLCLHGWPQHWYEWRHLMPALADRHRVLALDLRGFGWSQAPRDGYEKEELASDVLAVLDELGLERVKLVGHDWGGWIGFLLCLREPAALRALPRAQHPAALDQRPGDAAAPLAVLVPVADPQPGRSATACTAAAGSCRKCWSAPRPGARPGIRRRCSAFADDLRRAGARDGRRADVPGLQPARGPAIFRGRYARARLTVPTKMLFGTDDAALRPELLAGYERHAEAMEVELVDGCGHFIADEMPGLVAERAREFFA